MNKFITDGRLERLPPPAVHAQPEPPVANGQPIGRCELIVLVPAGVFFELIRGRIDQFDRLEFDSCLIVRQIPLLPSETRAIRPRAARRRTGWWDEIPGHRDRSEWRSRAGANRSRETGPSTGASRPEV